MVTVPNPVLVTLKLCVALFPTATLPKLRLAMLGESTPAPESCGAVFAELVYPAQLVRPTIATIIAIVAASTIGLGERITRALSCDFDVSLRSACTWVWALMSRSV